jgi:cytochrome bd-type quinol oxidase subunit 1
MLPVLCHVGGHCPVLYDHRRLVADRNGRQPWIVQGLTLTKDGVSSISSTWVIISLVGFVLVYGLVGVIDGFLWSAMGASHSRQARRKRLSVAPQGRQTRPRP